MRKISFLVLFSALILLFSCNHSDNTKIETKEELSVSSSNLSVLKVNDNDILHRLVHNSCTLSPVEYDIKKLTLEAECSTLNCVINVFHENEKIERIGNIYNIVLNEKINNIFVKLEEKGKVPKIYSVHITRYGLPKLPETPKENEVPVTVIISDGVNGSPVDGTYLQIYETGKNDIKKEVLVRKGKTVVNLEKEKFYDFKVSGRKAPDSLPYYAASDIISYYIGKESCSVSIIQRQLAMNNRHAKAPVLCSFIVNDYMDSVEVGKINPYSSLKKVKVGIKAASPVGSFRWSTPAPMLGLGHVPSAKNISVFVENPNQKNEKDELGNWASSWTWNLRKSLFSLSKDPFDVVVVVYDMAHNRLEYHVRFFNSSASEEQEDPSLTVENAELEFLSLPTNSNIFSVDKNPETGQSTHYLPTIRFDLKRYSEHVDCVGVELFRKDNEKDDDFKLVNRVMFDIPVNSKERKIKLVDTDSMLETGKEYEYMIIAYDNNGKKTVSSHIAKVVVPKPTVIFLQFPEHGTGLTLGEVSDLGFVFRYSEPAVLNNAEYLELGLIISTSDGFPNFTAKFKYVFDENGSPVLYFAVPTDSKIENGLYVGTSYSKKYTEYTNLPIDKLITVNKITGEVNLLKDFFSFNEKVNLAKPDEDFKTYYNIGELYYWDIVDAGLYIAGMDDDKACRIVCKTKDGCTIIYQVNDRYYGKNAWNGKSSYFIKPW